MVVPPPGKEKKRGAEEGEGVIWNIVLFLNVISNLYL